MTNFDFVYLIYFLYDCDKICLIYFILIYFLDDSTPHQLPLFGNFCCRLAAQPHSMNHEVASGFLDVQVSVNGQSPQMGRQYGIDNEAAIALQCKLNVKLIAAVPFILYSCLI